MIFLPSIYQQGGGIDFSGFDRLSRPISSIQQVRPMGINPTAFSQGINALQRNRQLNISSATVQERKQSNIRNFNKEVLKGIMAQTASGEDPLSGLNVNNANDLAIFKELSAAQQSYKTALGNELQKSMSSNQALDPSVLVQARQPLDKILNSSAYRKAIEINGVRKQLMQKGLDVMGNRDLVLMQKQYTQAFSDINNLSNNRGGPDVSLASIISRPGMIAKRLDIEATINQSITDAANGSIENFMSVTQEALAIPMSEVIPGNPESMGKLAAAFMWGKDQVSSLMMQQGVTKEQFEQRVIDAVKLKAASMAQGMVKGASVKALGSPTNIIRGDDGQLRLSTQGEIIERDTAVEKQRQITKGKTEISHNSNNRKINNKVVSNNVEESLSNIEDRGFELDLSSFASTMAAENISAAEILSILNAKNSVDYAGDNLTLYNAVREAFIPITPKRVQELQASRKSRAGFSSQASLTDFMSFRYPMTVYSENSGLNPAQRSGINNSNSIDGKEQSWGHFQFNLPVGELSRFFSYAKNKKGIVPPVIKDKTSATQAEVKSIQDWFDNQTSNNDDAFTQLQEEYVADVVEKNTASKFKKKFASIPLDKEINDLLVSTQVQFGSAGFNKIISNTTGGTKEDFINSITQARKDRIQTRTGVSDNDKVSSSARYDREAKLANAQSTPLRDMTAKAQKTNSSDTKKTWTINEYRGTSTTEPEVKSAVAAIEPEITDDDRLKELQGQLKSVQGNDQYGRPRTQEQEAVQRAIQETEASIKVTKDRETKQLEDEEKDIKSERDAYAFLEAIPIAEATKIRLNIGGDLFAARVITVRKGDKVNNNSIERGYLLQMGHGGKEEEVSEKVLIELLKRSTNTKIIK